MLAFRQFADTIPGQQHGPVEARIMLRGQPEPIRRGDLILVASLLEAAPQPSASAFPGLVLGDQGGAVRLPVPLGFGDAGYRCGLNLGCGPLGRAIEQQAQGLLDQAGARHRPRWAGMVQPVDLVIEPGQQGRVDPQRDRSAVRDEGAAPDRRP